MSVDYRPTGRQIRDRMPVLAHRSSGAGHLNLGFLMMPRGDMILVAATARSLVDSGTELASFASGPARHR